MSPFNTEGLPLWHWLQTKGTVVDMKNLKKNGEYIFTQLGKDPDTVVIKQDVDPKNVETYGVWIQTKKGEGKVVTKGQGKFYQLPTNIKKGGKRKSKKTRKARKARKGTYRKHR